ncbi:MAG: enoyl-CoA hydratase/isomerase family protein [Dehalococcoidia bacterium]|nr:enoyl-CoA hydratase/isomerase family protein [Dehalococcoidia bacterium]
MSNVRLAIDDRGVATITLDRPERLNAINMAMRDELWEHLAACRDIPDVRVIVFRGEGRAFSAGADISEFGTAPSVIAARSARHNRDVWWELLNHRCVTIACLHGFCFGAGLELPLCCDVRMAVEGATFALPEVTLGYIPSAGGTQTLPRIIPPGIAASMILTGEPIGMAAAVRWGLVDRAVTESELPLALEAIIAEALDGGAEALRKRRITMLSGTNATAAASLR